MRIYSNLVSQKKILAPNPYKRIKVREPSINGKDLDGDVPYSTLVDLNNLRGKNERKQGAVRNGNLNFLQL